MKGFLDYLDGNSILHKMHPLIKIFVSILICASAFVSSNYFYLIGIILFNLILGLIGDGKFHTGLFKRALGIFKGLFKMSIFLFILQILLSLSFQIPCCPSHLDHFPMLSALMVLAGLFGIYT